MQELNVGIFVIKKVKFNGKLVEFYFEGGNPDSFDNCCKSYMIEEIKFVSDDYIDNNGYKGLCVVWIEGADKPSAIFKNLNAPLAMN